MSCGLAFRRSVTWSPSNSLPITGVRSSCLYLSSRPEFTSGLRHLVWASGCPPRMLLESPLESVYSADGIARLDRCWTGADWRCLVCCASSIGVWDERFKFTNAIENGTVSDATRVLYGVDVSCHLVYGEILGDRLCLLERPTLCDLPRDSQCTSREFFTDLLETCGLRFVQNYAQSMSSLNCVLNPVVCEIMPRRLSTAFGVVVVGSCAKSRTGYNVTQFSLATNFRVQSLSSFQPFP